jgi:HlyD family secretion protein
MSAKSGAKSKVIIFVVILGGGTAAYYKWFHHSELGDFTLNGNVEMRDIKISFRGSENGAPVAKRVKKMNVEEGDTVRKGQELARLEDDMLKAQVLLAKTKLQEVEVELAKLKRDFNRTAALYKKGSTSEKIYEDTKNMYEIAMIKRDSAAASYDLAQIVLGEMSIRSPAHGVILTKNVEEGEMIAPGSPVFSLMPNDLVRVKTYGSGEIITNAKPGDKVTVTSDYTNDERFLGHISFISSEPEFTPKNIETKELRTSLVYKIRIILDEEKAKKLKPGTPVTVKFLKIKQQ